jgi:hypothetical protein
MSKEQGEGVVVETVIETTVDEVSYACPDSAHTISLARAHA